MKRIFIVIGIFLFLSLYSCSWFDNNDHSDIDTQQEVNEEGKTDTEPDSLNDSIALLKGQLDELVAKIDSIKQELASVQDLQEKSRKENRWNWIWNLLIVVSLIAAVLAIWLAKNAPENEKDIDKLNREFERLRQSIGGLHQGLHNQPYHSSNNDNHINNRICDLENNVCKILSDLKEIRQRILNAGSQDPIGRHGDDRNNNQTLYFRNIIGHEYFRSQESPDQPVFKANISGNRGTFEPLSLQVLKGNDNALDAIEIEAGVLPHNASQMTVISNGEIEKRADRWFIISKSKVKFI